MFFADHSMVRHTLSLVLAALCQRTRSSHRNRQQDFGLILFPGNLSATSIVQIINASDLPSRN